MRIIVAKCLVQESEICLDSRQEISGKTAGDERKIRIETADSFRKRFLFIDIEFEAPIFLLFLVKPALWAYRSALRLAT